ncbi:hypothetical protein GCM10022279_21010 [Comamonas faecalis]|uniref:Uncharacterized protein n=1 Tax=Comamonas faecalis TaxID=1387849 RepID=A0ABP7RGF9_9BURK
MVVGWARRPSVQWRQTGRLARAADEAVYLIEFLCGKRLLRFILHAQHPAPSTQPTARPAAMAHK